MRKNYIYLGMVVDRSGSMAGSKMVETRNGLNRIIQENKEDTDHYYDTFITLFDDKIEKLYEGSVSLLDEIAEDTIFARGMTSLYDAIGYTITEIGKILKDKPESKRPSKVLITVFTDGMENNSKEYTSDKIKEMINRQRNKYNWEFVFMGSSEDSALQAESMGFRRNRTVVSMDNGDGINSRFALYSQTVSAVANDSFTGYDSRNVEDQVTVSSSSENKK